MRKTDIPEKTKTKSTVKTKKSKVNKQTKPVEKETQRVRVNLSEHFSEEEIKLFKMVAKSEGKTLEKFIEDALQDYIDFLDNAPEDDPEVLRLKRHKDGQGN